MKCLKKEGRERVKKEKQLPDELRLELIKAASGYFEKILAEINDPDKILSDFDKENIFNETKNRIAELKNEFPDQFKKVLFIQHEILGTFNKFVKQEALQLFTFENQDDVVKGLAMMEGFVELPPKLKWNMYEILNKGRKSRVRKDQVNNVLEIYKKHFPDKKLWEEVEKAEITDKESAEKIKLESLDRIREEIKAKTEK